ncbi:hypothetical protein PIB30_052166 [Stylosanthes scabra]|uniref:Uncharacterized protein n=1 Tax=Stylosanthes scabra TaxID=79078 RepID=A0ABU6QJW2_9FABA|nr:hypothetical protein [Stylosanthes scabra]
MDQPSDSVYELDEPLMPPGFKRIPNPDEDIVVPNHKDARRVTGTNIRGGRRSQKTVLKLNDQEIEDADQEVEETWDAGRRVGIETELEDIARKYLRDLVQEAEPSTTKKSRKRSRGRKGKVSEIGDSNNSHS